LPISPTSIPKKKTKWKNVPKLNLLNRGEGIAFFTNVDQETQGTFRIAARGVVNNELVESDLVKALDKEGYFKS